MGYMAIVHTQGGNPYYLITENRNEGTVTNMITGLSAGEYSVLLYTIDEHGVPLKQAAGFPQTVIIHQHSSTTGTLYACIFPRLNFNFLIASKSALFGNQRFLLFPHMKYEC